MGFLASPPVNHCFPLASLKLFRFLEALALLDLPTELVNMRRDAPACLFAVAFLHIRFRAFPKKAPPRHASSLQVADLNQSSWTSRHRPLGYVLAAAGGRHSVLLRQDGQAGKWVDRNSYGCGSKPMVPFWGRCTTHFSLF